MQFFIGKNRGTISVFLSLILLPMIIFSGIVVDVSRLYAAKTVISGAGDLTMNAALSEYDKKLKDEYGLLAIADTPDSPKMKESLESYFKESCGMTLSQEKDAQKLHTMFQMELGEDGVKVKGVDGSSLAQTGVLKQQIMEYMKIRGPVYIIMDILEKMKKLPLKNMEEKRDYVKKKTEFGKALKKIGKPLQKAKSEVENHIASVSSVSDFLSTENSVLEEYKKGAVFWLAARSLENYLNGTTPLPGQRNGTIDAYAFRSLLSGAVVWDENNDSFDYMKYANLVASITLYRSKENLEGDVTVENGFTEAEIEQFQNIYTIVMQSVNAMDHIHDRKAEQFQNVIDNYMKAAEAIEESADGGVNALKKVLSVWKNQVKVAKENCEESKSKLEGLGEDMSGLDDEMENLEIKEEDVEKLISCLNFNKDTARAFKEYGEKLKQIPQKLKSLNVNWEEGEYLHNEDVGGLNHYWNNHSMTLLDIDGDFIFQNASAEKFYSEVLQKIDSGSEDENAKEKKNQNKQDAKDASDSYSNLLDTLEKFENSKDLKEFEGITYPDEFPSGIANAAAEAGAFQKPEALDTDDENVMNKLTKSDGFTSQFSRFLSGLDQLSGKTLERAYLMEYMTEMFNCLTTKGEETSLSEASLSAHYIANGEIEYILYGKEKTSENLAYAVKVLYGIRLAINGIYVFFDKTLNSEASSIAASLSTATGQAWLYPIIKYGYLCCVAITYSGQDVAALAQGEEVAVWRGKKDIKMNYKEYLKLFVLLALFDDNSEQRLLSRTGDCIQLNTGLKLKAKYTMLTMEADVKVSTIFLPSVPAFLGKKSESSDGKKSIRYKSVMAY